MEYLKTQPYVQTLLAPRSSNKLPFKFLGPFYIMERIGQSVYHLQLPDDYLIHPIFHVSHIRMAVAPDTTVSSTFPDLTHEF